MIWGKIWSWTMKYLVYDTWCLIIFCWKYKKIDYSNAECHHHNLECYHLQISIWNITNIYFNPLHIEHIHIHVYTVFQPFGYNITFSTLSTNILAKHDGKINRLVKMTGDLPLTLCGLAMGYHTMELAIHQLRWWLVTFSMSIWTIAFLFLFGPLEQTWLQFQPQVRICLFSVSHFRCFMGNQLDTPSDIGNPTAHNSLSRRVMFNSKMWYCYLHMYTSRQLF